MTTIFMANPRLREGCSGRTTQNHHFAELVSADRRDKRWHSPTDQCRPCRGNSLDYGLHGIGTELRLLRLDGRLMRLVARHRPPASWSLFWRKRLDRISVFWAECD